jgi:hypothetical protein
MMVATLLGRPAARCPFRDIQGAIPPGYDMNHAGLREMSAWIAALLLRLIYFLPRVENAGGYSSLKREPTTMEVVSNG